jgi:hypothetical protein
LLQQGNTSTNTLGLTVSHPIKRSIYPPYTQLCLPEPHAVDLDHHADRAYWLAAPLGGRLSFVAALNAKTLRRCVLLRTEPFQSPLSFWRAEFPRSLVPTSC